MVRQGLEQSAGWFCEFHFIQISVGSARNALLSAAHSRCVHPGRIIIQDHEGSVEPQSLKARSVHLARKLYQHPCCHLHQHEHSTCEESLPQALARAELLHFFPADGKPERTATVAVTLCADAKFTLAATSACCSCPLEKSGLRLQLTCGHSPASDSQRLILTQT